MKTIGIFLFDNVEVLDFAGPFEVFSVGSELGNYKNHKVITFSKDGKKVRAVNGLSVNPDFGIEDLPEINFLVIPGGDGSKQVVLEKATMDGLMNLLDSCEWTMTVCSGSRIPAKLGLLNGKPFCTHHLVYESIAKISPNAIPCPQNRFVQSSERLYTAAGISAGIDLSFFLLEATFGKKLAEETAKYMEYTNYPLPV
jgi:transcriptional regulator GlxA family with amidase domain